MRLRSICTAEHPAGQAQHHLVLASQAPALAGRERTSPSRLPCEGQHGRAALALAAHKPRRIDHRLSITFHAVVLQLLGTIRCPEKPRAAQSGVQVPQELRNRLDGPPPFTLSCARFVFESSKRSRSLNPLARWQADEPSRSGWRSTLLVSEHRSHLCLLWWRAGLPQLGLRSSVSSITSRTASGERLAQSRKAPHQPPFPHPVSAQSRPPKL